MSESVIRKDFPKDGSSFLKVIIIYYQVSCFVSLNYSSSSGKYLIAVFKDNVDTLIMLYLRYFSWVFPSSVILYLYFTTSYRETLYFLLYKMYLTAILASSFAN